MKRIQRDLRKLYQWAAEQNMVIEEVDVSDFWMPTTLGSVMNQSAILWENRTRQVPIPIDSAWIKLKKGMYPEQRLAVLAHEIGHTLQDEDEPKIGTVSRELDAWARAEKLLTELGVKPYSAVNKLKRGHIATLKRWGIPE